MKFTTRLAVALAAALFSLAFLPAFAQVLDSQTVRKNDVNALTGLPTSIFSDGDIVYVEDTKRGGWFKWVSGDQTALIGQETGGSVCAYLAPNADLTGASGTWARLSVLEGSPLRPGYCGAVGDGTTLDTNAVIAWLERSSEWGLTALAERDTFLVASIDLDLTNDLAIVLNNGATIKGNGSNTDPVLEFSGHATVPTNVLTVTSDGTGTIDASLRTDTPAVASGSGLVAIRFAEMFVDGLRITAGTDPSDGFGDSGIATQNVTNFRLCNLYIEGFDDIGIYLTGDGDNAVRTDDEGRGIVCDSVFYENEIGISARRQLQNVIFANNVVEGGRAGFQTGEAGSGGSTIYPPDDIIVIGNRITDVDTRCIEIRGAVYGSVISNNSCTDYNGEGSSWGGIECRGCTGVLIDANSIVQVNNSIASSNGVYLDTLALDVTLPNSGNIVSNNYIEGVLNGINQNAGNTNFAKLNTFKTFTNRYAGDIEDYALSYNANGLGIGKAPVASRSVAGEGGARFYRPAVATQYLDQYLDSGGARIVGVSDPTAAKFLRFNVTTTDTTVSGGALGMMFSINGDQAIQIDADGVLNYDEIPVYADNAAAVTGGLSTNDIYRTSTGALRIVIP